ncbi:MAG: AAA family ATPase [Hyphomicrobiales bacterium]|nr:AAA family ATPase [Hyphomicrobiales bacterium]MBV8662358.1 AAA family ATPase [Hyphomicrobiales bacterium]
MKIVELKVENFKKLRVAAIRPADPLVVISGDNGQGKSSALKAIVAALKGVAAAGPVPVRQGEEECRIKVDLGELVVRRSFKAGKDGEVTTKLTVTQADGAKPPGTPQAILNALLGDLSFDPLAFGRWKPQDQFDALRALVENFDFAAHDAAQKADYEARTNFNRLAKEHAAAAEKIALPDGPKPAPVVLADVLAELDAAQQHNAELDARVKRRADAQAAIVQKGVEAQKMRDEAAALLAEADGVDEEIEKLELKLAQAPALPAPTDLAPIRQRLNDAEAINATVRAHDERARHEHQVAVAEKASAELTAAMKAREEAKRAATAATKLPVDGLDLADGVVTFNGLPLAEAGTAERIRIGMAVGMSLNPKVKVVLCDEGSELDPQSLQMVADMAAERGYQVWVTRCSHDSGMPEVEIVDGAVAGAEAAE